METQDLHVSGLFLEAHFSNIAAARRIYLQQVSSLCVCVPAAEGVESVHGCDPELLA